MSLNLIRRFYCTPLFNYNAYYIKHIKSLKTTDDNKSYTHMYQALKYRIN